MRMEHRFTVPLPVDATWDLLTDLERIAPCMPGATLHGTDEADHLGSVRVKVGPITADYDGRVRFVEEDRAGHRAVLHASGRDGRGQGTAQAEISLHLTDQGHSTDVEVVTELAIAGKVGQFGRGALEGVSAKLLDQFVERLGELIQPEQGALPGTTPAGRAETVSVMQLIPRRVAVGGVVVVAAVVVLVLRRLASR